MGEPTQENVTASIVLWCIVAAFLVLIPIFLLFSQCFSEYGRIKRNKQKHSLKSFAFTRINLIVGKREVLKNVSGILRPGEICAVMGKSSCGKTTLLHTLAGLVTNGQLTGNIYLDGKLVKGSLTVHGKCGVMEQEDQLIAELTVRELLQMSADIQLKHLSKSDREKRIIDAVEFLSLSAILDRQIGTSTKSNLSGGQRRRVTLAIEGILSNHRLLFLDEPTTGLSSNEATKLIVLLYKLSRERGMAIMFSIHQPRAKIFLELVDKVLLLHQGEMAYFGAPNGIQKYFQFCGISFSTTEYQNPADCMMDVMCDNSSSEQIIRYWNNISLRQLEDEIIDNIEGNGFNNNANDQNNNNNQHHHHHGNEESQSRENSDSDQSLTIHTNESDNSRNQGFISMFSTAKKVIVNSIFEWYILLWFGMKLMLRNKSVLLVPFLIEFFYSILKGLIYIDIKNEEQYLSDRFSTSYVAVDTGTGGLALLSLFTYINILSERDLLVGRYAASAYCVLWICITLVRSILLSFANLIVFYWISGLLRIFTHFLAFFAISVMYKVALFAIVMVFSSITNSVELSATILSGLELIFFLTCSYYVPTNLLFTPLRWLNKVSLFYYSLEALVWIDMKNRDFTCTGSSNPIFDCPIPGYEYLEWRDSHYQLSLDFSVCAMYAVIPLFLFCFYILFIRTLFLKLRLSYVYRNHYDVTTLRKNSFRRDKYIQSTITMQDLARLQEEDDDDEDDHENPYNDIYFGEGDGDGGGDNDHEINEGGDEKRKRYPRGMTFSTIHPKLINILHPSQQFRQREFIKRSGMLKYLFPFEYSRMVNSKGGLMPTFEVENFTLQLRYLPYHLYKCKYLLDDISLSFYSREIVGIMGPSGSGKTKFLQSIAGYISTNFNTELYGEMKIFNVKVKSKTCPIGVLGYMIQNAEDYLFPTLTVKETLEFASHLQLPSSLSWRKKNKLIEQIMDVLQLTHLKDRRLGVINNRGISGGELKRVALAIELLRTTKILILDEPTSGLSATEAAEIIGFLHSLAHSWNYTIITSIHQPRTEILDIFDKLIVLSKGKVVFNGSSQTIHDYFEEFGKSFPLNENIADSLIDEVIADEENAIADQLSPNQRPLVRFYQSKSTHSQSSNLTPSSSPSLLTPTSSPKLTQSDELETNDSDNIMAAKLSSSNKGRNRVRKLSSPLTSRMQMNRFTQLFNFNNEDVEEDEEFKAIVKKDVCEETKKALSNPWYPSIFAQITALLERHYYLLRRKPIQTLDYLLLTALSAFVFGLFYLQIPNTAENVTYLMAASLSSSTTYLTLNTLPIFSMYERKDMIIHELVIHRYYPFIGWFVHAIISFVESAFGGFIFATITYYMIGLGGNYVSYTFYCLSYIVCGWLIISFQFVVIWGIDSIEASTNFTTLIIFLLGIDFSGFLVHLQNIPSFLRWISYLSVQRYICEMSFYTFLHDRLFPCENGNPSYLVTACPAPGDEFLIQFGYSDNPYLRDMLIVLSAVALFQCVGYFVFLSHKSKWSISNPKHLKKSNLYVSMSENALDDV